MELIQFHDSAHVLPAELCAAHDPDFHASPNCNSAGANTDRTDMLRSAFRSFSPLRLERRPPRPRDGGAISTPDVAEADQSATHAAMAELGENERAIVDALDEPALVVEGSIVRLANTPARKLLGSRMEGRDVRLAIRHPQALELILAHGSGEIDVTGIVEPG